VGVPQPRRPDPVSLVAGLALAALGAVLLLDRLEVVELQFGVIGPVVLAVLGALLLASGLSRPR
jgi:membrane-bound ClpP family serine protease